MVLLVARPEPPCSPLAIHRLGAIEKTSTSFINDQGCHLGSGGWTFKVSATLSFSENAGRQNVIS